MKNEGSEDSKQYNQDLQKAAYEDRRLDGVYAQSEAKNQVMVRIRAPGGQWKSRDLGSMAQIACDSGDGSLHFTTRGDVELHGVNVPDLDQVLDLIHQAG